MSSYTRPKAAVDVYLEEISEEDTKYRVRIVGTIVTVTDITILINDGTGQARLNMGLAGQNEFEVGTMGRFIAQVRKQNNSIEGQLIAWNEITQDQAKRYRRLIKLERRVPK